MTTVYVNSPFDGGQIGSIGNGTYCCAPGCCGGACNHTPCNPSDGRCVDIFGNPGTSVNLIVTYPNVRSINIVNTATCAPGCSIAATHNLVSIDLYTGQNLQGCWMGRVAFGHVLLLTPPLNGIKNLTSGSLLLGTVPGGYCASWYTTPHSHMEILGGSVLPLTCGQFVNKGNAIYKFVACGT